jgi:hypothetical protein
MANEVYANGMEIACKAAAGSSIAAFPDTCLSPPSPPAGPVPIPYPNTAYASDTTNGSTTVMISGEEVMLKDDSTFKKSTGDEAATKSLGMGVVTHAIQGEASFISWSMDVKIEGQNADRHLDQMLHNEQCNNPANTAPMLYKDAQASDPKETCEQKKQNFEQKCNPPKYKTVDDKEVRDCDDSCKEKQKCQLVAKRDDKKLCCHPSTTGHHALPVQELSLPGKPRGRVRHDSLKGYDMEDAPCVCAEGVSHCTRDGVQLKEHGLLGNAYIAARAEMGVEVGQEVSYSKLAPAAAKSVCKIFKCDEDCVKKQIDDYHITKAKIPPNDPVCRASTQPFNPPIKVAKS